MSGPLLVTAETVVKNPQAHYVQLWGLCAAETVKQWMEAKIQPVLHSPNHAPSAGLNLSLGKDAIFLPTKVPFLGEPSLCLWACIACF